MFITFEGIEGVGKSTQLKFMAEKLSHMGYSIVMTREPGGTHIGEDIRHILLTHYSEQITPMTELLLIFAARAQHVERFIQPALEQGAWVLCDRFIDATYAYQGGGRKISIDSIYQLEKLVLGNLKPNYTLIFDAPASIGLERIKARGNADRFEQEKIEFFERVREVYKSRAQTDPQRYKIIDAEKPLVEVQNLVLTIIQGLTSKEKGCN